MVAQRKRQLPCNQRMWRVIYSDVFETETKRNARTVRRRDGDGNIRPKTLDQGEQVLLSLQTRLQLEVALLALSLPDIGQVEAVHLGQRLNFSVMARGRKHFEIFLLQKVDDRFEKQDLFRCQYVDPNLPDGQQCNLGVASYLTDFLCELPTTMPSSMKTELRFAPIESETQVCGDQRGRRGSHRRS